MPLICRCDSRCADIRVFRDQKSLNNGNRSPQLTELVSRRYNSCHFKFTRSSGLKIASPLSIAIAAAAFSLAAFAQEPPSQPAAGGAGEHKHFQAPPPTT